MDSNHASGWPPHAEMLRRMADPAIDIHPRFRQALLAGAAAMDQLERTREELRGILGGEGNAEN